MCAMVLRFEADEATGCCRKLHNEGLQYLHFSPNIMGGDVKHACREMRTFGWKSQREETARKTLT
jgi:hypothetical protein